LSHGYTPGEVEITVKDFYSEIPIEGAIVKMSPGNYEGETDSDGIVTFVDITPYRNYHVAVTMDGYIEDKFGTGRTGFIWATTGETTEVTIPLKLFSTVTGRVTSDQNPVAGAMIVALEDRKDGLATVAATRSDDNGTYTINVPEGIYSLRAVADSYYETKHDLTVAANSRYQQDFEIKKGKTTLTFKITPEEDYYGNSVSFTTSNLLQHVFNQRYLMPIDIPEGAELVKSGSGSYIPTLPGNYMFVMFVIDSKGVGKEVIQTIEMKNYPPEAYPSVIPGPSELPLLYNETVKATSSGLTTVKADVKVFLRGWGKDFNLPSPETFNPDAPIHDIYGNKNGDWSQSAFTFSWRLKDSSGQDLTELLSNPDEKNPNFKVPADAEDGEIYTASLTVAGDNDLAGEPADVSILVASELENENECGICHLKKYNSYKKTKHASVGIGCQDCHGPASEHLKGKPMSTTHWPGLCGRCHDEFAQWQKSRHSDPLAFGHAEVSPALIRNCYKCHYTDGFIGAAASGNVEEYNYPFGTKAPADTPNVGCDVCHDPHNQSADNPVGIRTGSAGNVCGTCHEKKWQNATLRATAGEIDNGYHWDDYSEYAGSGNPHLKEGGCVWCHMSTDLADLDSNGVLKAGGHGLRMRDVGADGDPGTSDDLLNISVCQNCHGASLDTFDRNGFQTETKEKLNNLGNLLKGANHEFLPPFQPGKCATCHRGGTLPFINETADEILNNAFKNYSLILHDRSFGIHNPSYIERLLDDSINAVETLDNLSLSNLEAEPYIGLVIINWSTSYEKNLAKFNIYRATSKHGPYKMINESTISATGGETTGQTYSYEDKGLLNGINYYYKIESVDSGNNTFMHGPIEATLRFLYLLKNKQS
jgi:predicted CXXCH cytochrome family protein